MHCPIDQSDLYEKTWNDALIHRCACCHGVFLPGKLFREVMAQVAMHAHQTAESKILASIYPQRLCPADGKEMMCLSAKGVDIDVCHECKGIWLDCGELEKMILRYGVPGKQALDKIGNHIGEFKPQKNNVAGVGTKSDRSEMKSADSFDAIDVVEIAVDLLKLFD